MIFVTLGSQKFQFDRILREIDRLIESGYIRESVFAQIGYSQYRPKLYEYREFLDRDMFSDIIDKADKIITHGGTGAIVGAIKKEKKVIAIPRLQKFREHVDNHQIQIVKQFEKMRFIIAVYDIENLKYAIEKSDSFKFSKYKSDKKSIIESIKNFIDSI